MRGKCGQNMLTLVQSPFLLSSHSLFKTYHKLIVTTKKNANKIMPHALKGLSQS